MEGMMVETKLLPPQVKGKILRRERLLNLLQENLDKRLILVCADAGYGKTTLLAQFCAEFDKPFMFYDLDPSDNDLATFFSYLIKGIQGHYPDFGKRTLGVLPQTRNIEIIVGTFINEFVEHGGKVSEKELRKDFYIILDDYHHLQENKEIGNALEYLLRHIPHNLHLIISSRSMPPLNLAYYFAKQELFEIKREDLQFNMREIQALLREVYNLKISDVEIERIERHSEGWITGIQLILQKVSVVGEEKAKETLNGYIASGEEIFDYFAREVFESQPKEVQEFLMKTSILETLNPELCESILEIKNASEIFRYLLEEHLFITSVNKEFKYHPLFRKFLVERLKKTLDKDTLKKLNEKIALHFEKNQEPFRAVKYFLAAENFNNAAKIIEKVIENQGLHLIATGESNQLISFIDQIPVDILASHPMLLIFKAEINIFLGKLDEGEDILETASKYSKTVSPFVTVKLLHNMGIILFRRGRYKEALGILKKALKLLNKRDILLRAKIYHTLGWIKLHTGLYRDAGIYFQKGLILSQRIKHQYLTTEMINSLAVLESKKGNLDRALEHYESLINKFSDEETLNMVNIYGNAASIYIEKKHFEKALTLISKAEDLASKYNDRRSLIYLTGAKGNYYLKLKEFGTAISLFEKALTMNQNLGEVPIYLFAYHDLATIYMEKRDYHKSAEYLDRAERIIKDKKTAFYLNHLFLKAHLKLALKDVIGARKCLSEMLHIARAMRAYRDIFKAYFFAAKIAIEQGENKIASANLKRAIIIAQSEKQFGQLLLESSNNLDLFEFMLKKGIAQKYCIKVLEKLNSPEAKNLLTQVCSGKTRQKSYKLIIKLFGGLEVKKEDGTKFDIHWVSRKTKSLFCYLIVNRKMPISKDSLIEIFWPDVGIKEARHNLHTSITFIRNALQGILHCELPKKEIILYKDNCYVLNPMITLKVDTEEFDNLIETAKGIENKDTVKPYRIYQKALKIYKGDYCADLYDQWCDEKRTYYREMVCQLLKKMAEFQFSKKKFEQSLNLYRQALIFDKLDETIYQGIMLNLASIGNLKALKDVYEELKAILKSELNTEPSPETIKILKNIYKKPG
jgi:ATP/maltotriose-dependent transcriptional regulator MalT/two-component SAPR family response regulator